MLKTVHLQPIAYLYAFGNTPASCLTKSIPPDIDANLLLLGCGDVRNILFTVYFGAGHGTLSEFPVGISAETCVF